MKTLTIQLATKEQEAAVLALLNRLGVRYNEKEAEEAEPNYFGNAPDVAKAPKASTDAWRFGT